MSSPSTATADIYDDYSDKVQSCSTQLRTFGGRRAFSGQVRTITCLNDNVLVKTVLSEKSDGGVLVVDGGDSLDSALLGDLMADLGRKNGWAGVVIFGAVRDCVALEKIHFGVKALGTNPEKSGKKGSGEIDKPFKRGGVHFRPGQWIYCDEDGLLVSQAKLF